VADLDRSAIPAIKKAAERYGSDTHYEFGRAKFLGTQKQDGTDRQQQDRSRSVYEKIIAESPVQGSAEVWQGIRARWGKALTPSARPTWTITIQISRVDRQAPPPLRVE
jgi:hypothetical protein